MDKEVVEQQAMTTSKWELLNNEEDDEDVDGVEIEETVSLRFILGTIYLSDNWQINTILFYT